MSEFWIMRPFGPMFLIWLAFFLLILIAASLLVRGKSERTKALVISVACWVTLLGFFAYKYALSVDADPVEAEPLADPLESPNRPIEAVDPGCGPLNNEVEAPAETLAGEEEEE